MLQHHYSNFSFQRINQFDTSAILYSSGTTGRIKGVELTHRNFISVTSSVHYCKFQKDENDVSAHEPETRSVSLFPLPLFHVLGIFMLFKAVSLGETMVIMERFDFENMLKAAERYKVTSMRVSPSLVVAMAKSELVLKYDLSSLLLIGCGGAPLGREAVKSFTTRFPRVDIAQGYGMTETGGGVTRMNRPDECKRYGSTSRLLSNVEAKIVDPATGDALSPMQRGELWLRGPMLMKGEWMHNSAGSAFTPHIIHIGVGEGRFEILCLSGPYLLAESGSPRNRTGGLSISVCSADGQVIGGAIGGKLIASTLVQVVVSSFLFGGAGDITKPKTTTEPPSGDEKSPGVQLN